MSEVGYTWHDGGALSVTLARVEGTRGTPYRFGADGGEGIREIEENKEEEHLASVFDMAKSSADPSGRSTTIASQCAGSSISVDVFVGQASLPVKQHHR
jgi:hypothetical protein